MTTERHAGSPKGIVTWPVVAGSVSAITGVCLLPAALDKLLTNPPNASPGPGLGFTLLAVSAALIGIPAAVAFVFFLVPRIRRYRAWAATLTPEQRIMLRFAEGAAMEAGHLAARDRNRREDARLSDSVIGTDRTGDENSQ
jgi:hypothetical protein